MIRAAQLKDMPHIVRMAREFHSLTAYAELIPFDEDSFKQSIVAFMENNMATVLVADSEGSVHGMAAALAYQHWWNHDHWTGQELFWWVDKSWRCSRSGIGLLVALEDWAKDKHLKSFSMIHTPNLAPEGLARFYRKRGYQEWDHVFTKEM